MNIDELKRFWKRADKQRGCLRGLKTRRGRRKSEYDEEDPFRMDSDFLVEKNQFIADKAKILSSKGFRRLKDKTQVFTDPKNPFIRTRLDHVLEVVAVSTIAADMLGLNTDLVEAAAFGHDIGHVPLGHPGEHWMATAMGRPEFCHEKMGPIITQKIERRGRGLNLTHETLEAMMRHSGNMAKDSMSAEAWVLRHTDKFTYIFHDVNDIFVRMKFPDKVGALKLANEFGENQRQRTTTAMAGLVLESEDCGKVSFEKSALAVKFKELRDLMYKVYVHVTRQNVEPILEPVLNFLVELGIGDPFLILALMTDRDVLRLRDESNLDMQAFNKTSVCEIVPHLAEIGKIDLCDPDLDW